MLVWPGRNSLYPGAGLPWDACVGNGSATISSGEEAAMNSDDICRISGVQPRILPQLQRSRFKKRKGTTMMRMLIACLVLAPVGAVAGQEDPVVGSGVAVTETRELPEFDVIELHISGDVQVQIGKPTALEIAGDDNIVPLVKTEVSEGRLAIEAERAFKTKHALTITVTVADLKAAEIHSSGGLHIRGLDNKSISLAVHGSGNVSATGKTEQLAVAVHGSGDVAASDLQAGEASVAIHSSGDAEVQALGSLDAVIHGSGDLRAVGKAERLTASIHGSGDLKAYDLKAREASVSIHGSGDAKVNVTESLNVVINGSGDVDYRGKPRVRQVISGSGDVTPNKYGRAVPFGAVSLQLGDKTATNLACSTHNGSITCRRELTAMSKSRRRLTGWLGDSEAKLVVETHNGSIDIKIAGSSQRKEASRTALAAARLAIIQRWAGWQVDRFGLLRVAADWPARRLDPSETDLSDKLLARPGQGRRLDELAVGVEQSAGPDEPLALQLLQPADDQLGTSGR